MSTNTPPPSTDDAGLSNLDWDKGDGLLPAVVQHAVDGRLLMVGYMNRDALAVTLATGRVTFHSRSKSRLWTKGESSGHFLELVAIAADCDRDALLVQARPVGPTCHQGTDTCFEGGLSPASSKLAFLTELENIVADRIADGKEGSYTARMFASGIHKMAQKVGEEGVETALAAVGEQDDAFIGECADLLFHLALLLRARGKSLPDVVDELARRHAERAGKPS